MVCLDSIFWTKFNIFFRGTKRWIYLQGKFFEFRVSLRRCILCVFWGPACSAILVKRWNFVTRADKCEITIGRASYPAIYLNSLPRHTHPFEHLHISHRPQLCGWYGSHFLNQESTEGKYHANYACQFFFQVLSNTEEPSKA